MSENLVDVVKRMEAKIDAQNAKIAELEARPTTLIATTKPPRKVIEPTEKDAYAGPVRAKFKCFHGGLRLQGEVFPVELPALWTDDPFVPVFEVKDQIGNVGYVDNDKLIKARLPAKHRPCAPIENETGLEFLQT